MKNKLKAGSTSQILHVFIQDSSVSTGAGLTGLTNASGSLVAYYMREGASAATAITLASATLGTYTSGGFKEVSSANMPGVYEFHPPDAAIAAGAKRVVIILKGATNMAPCVLEIELDTLDYQDSVRFGLTALPNAAAGASGGLPLGDASGRVDLGKWLGTAPNALIAGMLQALGCARTGDRPSRCRRIDHARFWGFRY
jgi:hypothetical protein